MFFLERILYFIVYLIETSICFRFILKFLNASIQNGIVKWIYEFSDVLVNPFVGILKNLVIKDFVIESSSLIALFVYAFVGFIIIEFVHIITFHSEK